MTKLPKFSVALLHPRYWLTWLGIGALWLVVQLPYPVIYKLLRIGPPGATRNETPRENRLSQP